MPQARYPNNAKYITGEYLIARNIEKPECGLFFIESIDVDNVLISSANAKTNKITLIDGSVHSGITFTIQPLFDDGTRKDFSFTSFKDGDGKIKVVVNTKDVEVQDVDNDTQVENT